MTISSNVPSICIILSYEYRVMEIHWSFTKLFNQYDVCHPFMRTFSTHINYPVYIKRWSWTQYILHVSSLCSGSDESQYMHVTDVTSRSSCSSILQPTLQLCLDWSRDVVILMCYACAQISFQKCIRWWTLVPLGEHMYLTNSVAWTWHVLMTHMYFENTCTLWSHVLDIHVHKLQTYMV